MNWRDQEWSANIQEILQEPDSRVVVFGGCGHFRDGAPDGAPPVLNSLLEKSGINSVAVHTTGSDFEPDPGPDGSFFTKVTRAQENVMEAADNAEPSLNQTEFTIKAQPTRRGRARRTRDMMEVTACICGLPVENESRNNNLAIQCGYSGCETSWVCIWTFMTCRFLTLAFIDHSFILNASILR